MHNLKVAAIHDISGYGRCALSVILPVMSVMGVQVCPIPTAVLSTHTGGFDNMAIVDMTDYISNAYNHYKKLEIEFDAVYSGFLASKEQVDSCLEFFKGHKEALKVVDPVMGDNGRPYKTCTPELRERMSELVEIADIITPNVTEAAMLLDEEYPPVFSTAMAKSWLVRLSENVATVVITSVPFMDNKISNIGYDRENNAFWRVDCDYTPVMYPGTGDIFASILTASLLKGDSLPIAINTATEFIQMAVKMTYSYKAEPRSGIMFEQCLGWLTQNNFFSGYTSL